LKNIFQTKGNVNREEKTLSKIVFKFQSIFENKNKPKIHLTRRNFQIATMGAFWRGKTAPKAPIFFDASSSKMCGRVIFKNKTVAGSKCGRVVSNPKCVTGSSPVRG
jgi:hypothetical protein